ncbi:MAG TPA: hypothetical protein VFY20_01680 [Gemmatimonadales bacterium]|nr:hypothetical protein [Gemmatimonadales bacterium]
MSRSLSPAQTMALILGMPLVLAVIYYSYLAVNVSRSPYSWREMDWNGDGRTTLGEFFATTDVIRRPVTEGGRACDELVSARTGRRYRMECPDSAR